MKRIEVNVVTGERVEVDLTPDEIAAAEARAAADVAERTAPLRVIDRIERDNPITHRALREFFLGFGEVNPAFKATLLYTRVKAADDAIKAERAKL